LRGLEAGALDEAGKQAAARLDPVLDAALDAAHAAHPAVVRDVGGLARPRRYRAQPWYHPDRLTVRRIPLGLRIEQRRQPCLLVVGQRRFAPHRVDEAGFEAD